MESLKAYVDQRFAAIDMADSKYEFGVQKRFESVNEFRAVLSDQATRLMPRSEYESSHLGLSARVNANSLRIDGLQLALTELTSTMAGQRHGIGLLGTIVMGSITALASALLIITFIAQHFAR